MPYTNNSCTGASALPTVEQDDTLARRDPSVPAHLLGAVSTPPHRAYLPADKPDALSKLRGILINADHAARISRIPYDHGDIRSVATDASFFQPVRRLVFVRRWSLRTRLRVRMETLISEFPESLPVEEVEHELNTKNACIVMPVGVRR